MSSPLLFSLLVCCLFGAYGISWLLGLDHRVPTSAERLLCAAVIELANIALGSKGDLVADTESPAARSALSLGHDTAQIQALLSPLPVPPFKPIQMTKEVKPCLMMHSSLSVHVFTLTH